MGFGVPSRGPFCTPPFPLPPTSQGRLLGFGMVVPTFEKFAKPAAEVSETDRKRIFKFSWRFGDRNLRNPKGESANCCAVQFLVKNDPFFAAAFVVSQITEQILWLLQTVTFRARNPQKIKMESCTTNRHLPSKSAPQISENLLIFFLLQI